MPRYIVSVAALKELNNYHQLINMLLVLYINEGCNVKSFIEEKVEKRLPLDLCYKELKK